MLIAAAIVGLVAFGYMNQRARSKAMRINCINNLKSIGLSFPLWAEDNGGKYPAQASTNAGGTMELVTNGFAFPNFVVMSNELSTPKVLVCPDDSKRTFATNFDTLADANVSYFVVPEANETLPQMWLSGDRNLATNNVPLKPGLFSMQTNRMWSWTAQLHNHRGNLCFADGSVQQLPDARLRSAATTTLRAYFEATTNMAFRLAIP